MNTATVDQMSWHRKPNTGSVCDVCGCGGDTIRKGTDHRALTVDESTKYLRIAGKTALYVKRTSGSYDGCDTNETYLDGNGRRVA